MGAWIVTPAMVTAAQTSTTLGSSGQSGSGVDVWSDVVIPLGAVLVGALASLGGSVLVNRWQLRKTARLEVWEVILPELTRQWTNYTKNVRLGEDHPLAPPVQEQLSALRRKAVLLKRRDKEASKALQLAWLEWSMVRIKLWPGTRPEHEQPPETDYTPLREAEQSFSKTMWDYFDYVEEQLQAYHSRIVSLFSRLFKKRKRQRSVQTSRQRR